MAEIKRRWLHSTDIHFGLNIPFFSKMAYGELIKDYELIGSVFSPLFLKLWENKYGCLPQIIHGEIGNPRIKTPLTDRVKRKILGALMMDVPTTLRFAKEWKIPHALFHTGAIKDNLNQLAMLSHIYGDSVGIMMENDIGPETGIDVTIQLAEKLEKLGYKKVHVAIDIGHYMIEKGLKSANQAVEEIIEIGKRLKAEGKQIHLHFPIAWGADWGSIYPTDVSPNNLRELFKIFPTVTFENQMQDQLGIFNREYFQLYVQATRGSMQYIKDICVVEYCAKIERCFGK